jgi:hypothetical protein
MKSRPPFNINCVDLFLLNDSAEGPLYREDPTKPIYHLWRRRRNLLCFEPQSVQSIVYNLFPVIDKTSLHTCIYMYLCMYINRFNIAGPLLLTLHIKYQFV